MASAEEHHPEKRESPEVVNQEAQNREDAARIEAWMRSYSGPIPPADELAAYNRIEPDLVNRIVSMAEDEALHRRSRENRELSEAVVATRRGQYLSFAIAALALGAGLGMVALGADPIAIVLILGAVGTLVTIILTGGKSDNGPPLRQEETSSAGEG